MSLPMVEHRNFSRGFNVDGKLCVYHPLHVRIKDKLRVKDWASELNTNYPQPRLMTDEMRKFTVWFFQTFQRQRESLLDHTKHPLEMFLPYQKTLKGRARNITSCYIASPTDYCAQKHKYGPLMRIAHHTYSPNIIPPRFNITNYKSYT